MAKCKVASWVVVGSGGLPSILSHLSARYSSSLFRQLTFGTPRPYSLVSSLGPSWLGQISVAEFCPMKVLVLGSGGREHAIAWKIRESRRVSKVYCAPG